MDSDELDRELDRLWAKAGNSPISFDPAPDFSSQDAASEAIRLLKRRHLEQESQWDEMIELKDKALQELKERLRMAEETALQSHGAARRVEDRFLKEMYDVAAKLESSRDALEVQERKFKDEEKLLREILDKTRLQLSMETKRWRELERQWNEREQQYLSDLHDMQERSVKVEQEAGRRQEEARKREDDLKEAKRAIEATLTELLAERRLREEANQDRGKANQRVLDLTERLTQIQKAWDEERKQWQELWDRERSTWEVQRQEFASWEERLRKEREAWHAELKQKEAEVLRFSGEMTETLKQSAETGHQLSQLLKAASAPSSGVRGPFIPHPYRRWAAAAAAALALGLAMVPVWRYATKIRLTLASSQVLPLDNPTALATDGNALWASEWSGELAALSPENPSTVLTRYTVAASGPYHPISIAVSGDYLWSLDAAQGRIFRHALADPTATQGSWAAPGPAPVAIAHDGRNLWSYDAVTKAFYRHSSEQPSETAEFRTDADMVPTSFAWFGGELWAHDGRGHRLIRFSFDGKALQPVGVIDRFDSTTLSIAGFRKWDEGRARRVLWALCGTGRGGAEFSVKKFLVSP